MVGIAAADKSINASRPVALVTGASSGIGETFARKLAAKGYRVILVARRKERLETLAAELPDAVALPADLTLDSDLRKIETFIATEPQLDFLINNAGFGIPGCYFQADVEAQNRMHQLHVLAIGRLTHAALRGMVTRRKGNIINVSSMAGFIQAPFSVSYNATKSWINSFSEGLYLELKTIHSPVRIQALCPGFTYTEFQQVAGVDPTTIPKSLWMPADFVVNASLRGLERNKLFVIPGWRYRLGLAAIRLLPQSLIHFYAMKYGRRRNPSGSGSVSESGSNTHALNK